jgi:hypothetical protein
VKALIIYPQKAFFSSVKSAVAATHEIEILFRPRAFPNFFEANLRRFIAEESTKNLVPERSWQFVACLLMYPGFFSAYFYAKAAGYRGRFADGSSSVVFQRPTATSSKVE